MAEEIPDRNDWISELPESIREIQLNKLAIPGSHNSGSFALDVSKPTSQDAPSSVRQLCDVPVFGAMTKSVVHRWSVCQNLNFKQQLRAGVRYFDLRIARDPATAEFHFVHGLYGPKLEELVRDVKEFIKDHRKEIILLDLNHLYGMELEHHIQLVTFLLDQFGDKICTRFSLEDLTLNNLWKSEKQVLLFYHDSSVEGFDEIWPGDNIPSAWPNVTDIQKCLDCLTKVHSKQPPKSFLVSQGILTPRTDDILKKLGSGSLQDMNKKMAPRLCEWIDSSHLLDVPPNVIIADFVEQGDFIHKVISLNKTRNS